MRVEAKCLISPLASFISSPDVLQDMFLVLIAKVLKAEVNVGPRCVNSGWARQRNTCVISLAGVVAMTASV